MTNYPVKISQKVFKKMISGEHNYVPEKVSQELKRAGQSGLFYKSEVEKTKALRALKTLKEKGFIPKYQRVEQMYNRAAKIQQQQNQALKIEKARPHIRANIMEDIAREQLLDFDPRSSLGRVLQKEKETAEDQKDNNSKNQKTASLKLKSKPPTVDLPDLDIG